MFIKNNGNTCNKQIRKYYLRTNQNLINYNSVIRGPSGTQEIMGRGTPRNPSRGQDYMKVVSFKYT